MKKIIHFHIYKGESQYIAEGIGIPVVTEGKTLDELAANIEEAVGLALEGEDLADFGLAPNPSVLMTFEFPAVAHA